MKRKINNTLTDDYWKSVKRPCVDINDIITFIKYDLMLFLGITESDQQIFFEDTRLLITNNIPFNLIQKSKKRYNFKSLQIVNDTVTVTYEYCL